MGARRIRSRACRFAGLGPLAGPRRYLVGAGGERFLRMHRVGGRPALEQRKNRPERHLLLRNEPMAGGLSSAAASDGDVRMGGRGRLLPRHGPSRRHLLQRLRPGLARDAGLYDPERARHARVPQPHERRLGFRPRNAVRGGVGRQPQRFRRGRFLEQTCHR